ncbi:TIGR04219 family outer membrane beta-barrel protein [Acinetobacter indicus]|uniref:TIGR04219 family outer membrane beta-barrel protein n=1 Tax=Acinetobacter indicus TaxID=756892 RepID=A0A7S6VQ51_9GAMM|nr:MULTISPECIES: TIGR04219 family outer membrane beta-barrel protein [Acinetobacter]QOW42866.1 TIGR04219 family outer membrane beta-barrel protein [Acinetobacter indicus]
MRTRPALCFILGLGCLSAAQADIIGVKGNVDYWHYNSDLSSALGQPEMKDDSSLSFALAVEHPVPLLPNVKIKHSTLEAESEREVLNEKMERIDLDYSDFIVYYEILDNIVSADIGVGAKVLDGTVQQNLTEVEQVSETLPMLYAEAGVKLPFTGLSAKAEASYAKFDDTVISDAQAELKYNFIDNLLVDVGLKAGYRILDVELNEGDERNLQLDFKGPYLGLEAHF